MGYGFFDMFSIAEFLFPLFFITILTFIFFQIFRGIKQWSENNNQPVLDVSVTIKAKRLR
ncbi:DUF2500 family protein [Bacillus sp. ISL-47]|nr:DUF2500 family protein [Bacillus sp. ISL-47]MBT2710892.1 DUF2500 family protein [Pseudomonas sp. ISL-84]